MTQDDFERLQTLLATRAGFRLTRDRIHLAEHRLAPVARREGFDSVDALLAALWARPVASLAWAVIETMLNGETW
ncbi:MAG TPA: protein-glutamate O-methyltransferase CheR, partial [Brevundimonas sp.]